MPAPIPHDSRSRRELARALERSLVDLEPECLVLVGCSGGADSLALAVVAADCQARGLIRAGAIVIDHRLQPGSSGVALAAGQQCVELGLSPVEVIEVDVATGPGAGGPESAARDARRAALVEAARRHEASAVLLAHTLDDQAETVLLGLARGSGGRSLRGMAGHDGLWRRPLLSYRRSEVRSVCDSAGLTPHEDPHNVDPAFARVRTRETVLPILDQQLGPGVPAALARTADLLRADGEALDEWTSREATSRISEQPDDVSIDLAGADLLPIAIRTRLIRVACLQAGVTPGGLASSHLYEIDRLVSSWRGQGPVRLPGDFEAVRRSGRLVIKQMGPLDLAAEVSGALVRE